MSKVLFQFPHDVSAENCQNIYGLSACGEGAEEKRWLLFAGCGRGQCCGLFALSATSLVVTPIAFVCWKTLSFFHFLLVFPHTCLCGPSASGIALPFLITSAPGTRFCSPLPSYSHSSDRSENRFFQLGVAVKSTWFILPRHCCSSCTLCDPSVVLVHSPHRPPPPPPPPLSQHSQGENWEAVSNF